MTCAERMNLIRIMNKMDEANKKEADGVYRHRDRNGKVLMEAKMVKKEEA